MRSSRRGIVLLLAALALAALAVIACTPQGEQEQPTTTPEATQEPTPTVTYSAQLAAVQGVETTATGSSSVEVQSDAASFTLEVQNLSDVTVAHIHLAEQPGGSGPPVVWLYPSPKARQPEPKPGVTDGELSSGTFEASDLVGPLEGMTMEDLVAAINENRAYVNVHTSANPDGEISGFLRQ